MKNKKLNIGILFIALALVLYFTLKDDFSNLYLCVCYELCEYQKWFIANIDFNDLKEMNDNKKSVLESFLKNQSLLQAQRKRFLFRNRL